MNSEQPIVLVVEDEELFASKVEMQLEKLSFNCAGIVDNANDALELLENIQVDLVIMDVNIHGEYDGIELAEMIVDRHDVPILYVTSNVDDMTFKRASRNPSAGFITKPFSDIQLQRSIEGAIKKQLESSSGPKGKPIIENGVIFIRKNNKIEKVVVDEIYYLEADGRYSRIYTKSEVYLVRQSLKAMTELLSPLKFISCHRSFVVNISKVKSVDLSDDVVILEERSIPLSRREKDKLLEKLNYI